MNYTKNVSTKLRNKGFELVRETKDRQALTKGKLTVNILHFTKQVILSIDKSQIGDFTQRELDILDNLLNQSTWHF